MCMAKVVLTKADGVRVEIGDVLEVRAEGGAVRVTTLFDEEHTFPGLAIGRVDLRSGVISLIEEQNR
ncbi:hypothetical protein CKO38_10490 [Rhodospirillum rubrum]|uniref:CO dehydrogenase nickel-binding accessory protein CooT n=1 Tax=Rhodospirillum rubrum TaxID=1085 RepID=UPI00190806F2|nr:CO dehydrogenase nickel-binding accessory protein CooT [Rhodospirillum rubrum]MBK1662900.1 hypothetical protein [Rhodospirillum rubrum]MBK1677086.1 hypothetical protein [Rhodospirillum rubrum]